MYKNTHSRTRIEPDMYNVGTERSPFFKTLYCNTLIVAMGARSQVVLINLLFKIHLNTSSL